jgi:mRNA interferase MazF
VAAGLARARLARGQIARGDVRLYQFAPPDKNRPVLVLTRNSAIAYLSTVTVAPVTSTIRGVPSEAVLYEDDGMKSPCAVNLHNAVTVSQQRMGKRVAQLSPARMNEVCAALRFSLGCDANYLLGTICRFLNLHSPLKPKTRLEGPPALPIP